MRRPPEAPVNRPPLGAVRPEIRALSPYTLDQTGFRFKLDQNESPWEPPRRVKERVARELLAEPWAQYPSFHGDELREPIARRFDWPMDGVLVGNGSNELLAATVETLIGHGGELLGIEPSFSLFAFYAIRAGGKARFSGPRQDLAIPLAELTREIERDPARPLILATPNNPTGEALAPEAVAGLAARLRAPLLLDNAYGEFSEHDYRPLLDEHANVMLFRTFSKAWALGGLRVGFVLAHPELVAELIKVKLPYNLGRASIIAARATLAEAAAVARRVRVLVGRRAQWQAMLAGYGFEVFPSDANFVLVRLPSTEAACRLHAGLAARGILVRDMTAGGGLAGCLRFTVADGRALRAVDHALKEIHS